MPSRCFSLVLISAGIARVRAISCAALLILLPVSVNAQNKNVSGTYSIWVCAETCTIGDTARAEAKGYVVLGDTPFDLRDIPLTLRLRLFDVSSGLLDRRSDGREMANACFTLLRPPRTRGWAGITPVALTIWTKKADTVALTVFASPDASYTLKLIPHAVGWRGVGRASGYIGGPFSKDEGHAFAKRVGDTDLVRCLSHPSFDRYRVADQGRVQRDEDAVLSALDQRDQAARRKDAAGETSIYDEYIQLFNAEGNQFTMRDSLSVVLKRRYANPSFSPPPVVWSREPRLYLIAPGAMFVWTVDEWPVSGTTRRSPREVMRRISTLIFRKGEGGWKIDYEHTQVVRAQFLQ